MARCVRRSPEKRRDVLCCVVPPASFSFTQEFDLMKAVETRSHKLWDAAQYKRSLPSVQCCNYITQRAECWDVERSGGFSFPTWVFVLFSFPASLSQLSWMKAWSMEEEAEESFFMLKLQRSESRSHVDPVNQGSLPLNLRRFDLGIKPTTWRLQTVSLVSGIYNSASVLNVASAGS